MPLTVLQAAYPYAPVRPDGVGGAEEILCALDRALLRHGHRCLVVAYEGSAPAGELHPVPLPGFRDRELSDEQRTQVQAAYQASLDRVLRSTHVDLVHMHGLDFLEYRLPRDIPVLVTLHLPIAWYMEHRPGNIWSRLGSNVHLQCVSEQQLLSCPVQMRPVTSIVNGVEIPRCVPPLKSGDACLPREFALVLGRICPEKNAVAALQAGTLAGLPVLIGGEVFPYQAHQRYFHESLEPLLNDPQGPQHRFLGPLAPERRLALLSRACCLLHPTLAPETSSLVAMEALAAGTPVIAYPSGALPQVVQDGITGRLVNSPEAMAAAIPEVAQFSRELCQRTAAIRFSRDRMIAEYFALYEKLASGHRQPVSEIKLNIGNPAVWAEPAHR